MRARKQIGFFILSALILMPLKAQQTFSNSNIIVTFPSMVQSVPGTPTIFRLNAEAAAGSQHNVWTSSCTSPGTSVTTSPQFPSLLPDSDTTITGTIAPTGAGTFQVTCIGQSGIRGGEDVPFNLAPFPDVQ